MKAKYSEFDSKGRLQVACCECQRGGNGNADCSAGFRSKRWDFKACFCGTLLEKFDRPTPKTEKACGKER